MSMAVNLWEEVDRIARSGGAPLVVVDSEALPPIKRTPGGQRKPGMRNKCGKLTGSYRTQYTHGQSVPHCAVCKGFLNTKKVLVCSDECKDLLMQKAETIIEVLTNPPPVVYVDFLRGGFLNFRRSRGTSKQYGDLGIDRIGHPGVRGGVSAGAPRVGANDSSDGEGGPQSESESRRAERSAATRNATSGPFGGPSTSEYESTYGDLPVAERLGSRRNKGPVPRDSGRPTPSYSFAVR